MRRPQGPASFLPLSQAEFQILLSVNAQPRHGYAIMQEVDERCGPTAVLGPGTLYGAIKRLRRAGLIEEVEGGSARQRPYAITPLGRRVAVAEAERHKELVRWAEATGL
jgi:DNA-binding PadR family transcriptional regulator